MSLAPHSSEDLIKRAHAALENHEPSQARGLFEQLLAFEPESVAARYGLARCDRDEGRFESALTAFQWLVTQVPKPAFIWNQIGITYRDMGRLSEAEAALHRALEVQPSYWEAAGNLGVVSFYSDRLTEAETWYLRALEMRPEEPWLHVNLGIVYLKQGRFPDGFREYEWRLKTLPSRLVCQSDQPRWNGQPIAGKRLLLIGEQGMGDSVQFIRYAPILKAQGIRIAVACQPGLKRLFEAQSFADQVSTLGEAVPPHDFHVPLLSLPLILGTTLETVPSSVPYLSVSRADSIREFMNRACPQGTLKIGINWSGNPRNLTDRYRSCRLSDLAPLFKAKGVTWVSVQVGASANELADAPVPIVDTRPVNRDLRDLADIMGYLDRVISVETSVSHLAGALAKPADVLLSTASDWRYLTDRADCLWYPSMRLFRQVRMGEWAMVVEALVPRCF